MGDRTSFVGNLASSAFSASFAEVCTIPIDTAKVRLQLQGAAAKAGAKAVAKAAPQPAPEDLLYRSELISTLQSSLATHFYVKKDIKFLISRCNRTP